MTQCQPRASPHLGVCCCCHHKKSGFVVSSSIGPISDFYCQECLNVGAEPEWGFEYLYSMVGTRGEGLSDHVKNLRTFKDSKYWTWDEWFTWRRLPEQAHLDENITTQSAQRTK